MTSIRVICVENDYGNAANVGGPVNLNYKTFEVDAAEVVAWLSEKQEWKSRSVVGVEINQPAKGTDHAER